MTFKEGLIEALSAVVFVLVVVSVVVLVLLYGEF